MTYQLNERDVLDAGTLVIPYGMLVTASLAGLPVRFKFDRSSTVSATLDTEKSPIELTLGNNLVIGGQIAAKNLIALPGGGTAHVEIVAFAVGAEAEPTHLVHYVVYG
ncbi:MAG: hypothetical protein ACLGIM_18275 [Alphaproteobacteria bacterium]